MSRLTDTAVKAAKPTDKTQDIYDEGEPGLCLRVQPSGKKGWGLRIRFRGVQHRYAIGDYGDPHEGGTSLAEARDLAAAMKKAAARGIDPREVLCPPAPEEPTLPTVADAIARYMETKKDNRSHDMEQRRFALHVKPVIGEKRIDEVTKGNVADLLHDMAHRAGLKAEPNRVFTSLTGFWSWAVNQQGYRPDNPMAGMKRPIKVEPSQLRQKQGTVAILTLDELRRLWSLAESIPSSVLPDLVLCMVAVPLRREEWTALRWSEVREVVEDGWSGWALKLPAERMKGRRPATVPLPAVVVDILNARRRLTGRSGYVFSVPGRDKPFAGWRRGADMLRSALEADVDWTPHDLRRSVATALARDIGSDTEVIKRILQHSDDALLGVTAVYQRSARLKDQFEALTAWTDLVRQSGAMANVVSLGAAHVG